MHTFTRSLLAVILTLHAQFVTPAQNVEAEHHCQAFLTSSRTAPIASNAVRLIDDDNAAEVWCRQVLEDPDLPPAIKGVVMEGLVHLFEAHTKLGLADRQADAYAMHQNMVMEFPDVAKFLRKAAQYAAYTVGDPEAARVALKARLGDVRRETEEEQEEAAAAEALLADLDAKVAREEGSDSAAAKGEEETSPGQPPSSDEL